MLKQIRKSRKLTQLALAQLSGVDHSIISRMESGSVQRPSWEYVGRLALALNVSPYEIWPLVDRS